jgi:hypothetical protein
MHPSKQGVFIYQRKHVLVEDIKFPILFLEYIQLLLRSVIC